MFTIFTYLHIVSLSSRVLHLQSRINVIWCSITFQLPRWPIKRPVKISTRSWRKYLLYGHILKWALIWIKEKGRFSWHFLRHFSNNHLSKTFCVFVFIIIAQVRLNAYPNVFVFTYKRAFTVCEKKNNGKKYSINWEKNKWMIKMSLKKQ